MLNDCLIGIRLTHTTSVSDGKIFKLQYINMKALCQVTAHLPRHPTQSQTQVSSQSHMLEKSHVIITHILNTSTLLLATLIQI